MAFGFTQRPWDKSGFILKRVGDLTLDLIEQRCKRGCRRPMELEEAEQLKRGIRLNFEVTVHSHSILLVLVPFAPEILELQHQHFGLLDHAFSF